MPFALVAAATVTAVTWPDADPETARANARREHVIGVALRHFAAQGFRGASIAAIASEAGVSEAGLLHHYPSKRRLLFGVLDHFATRLWQPVSELERGGGSFCDALVEGARHHETDPTFIRLFVVLAAESVNPSHPAHEWFKRRYDDVRAHFADRLGSDQERGFIRADADPQVVARLLISILDGLRIQFLLTDGELRIAAPLDTFLDRFRVAATRRR